MDKEFSRLFWEREGFPQEARQALDLCLDRLERLGKAEALDGIGAFYRGNDFDADLTQPLLEDLALETEISVYTLWLLLLIDQAKTAFGDYKALGVPEQVVWDTFQDLTYKLLECKQVYGVWGTFVASWYHIFFTCDIVKLGRLEFESTVYDEAVPYRFGDFTLEKGDPVKSIHIPSSGEPFTWEARLDSYKRAYRFFQKELNGGPLVCVCGSWLLYPPYREILSPQSNIVSFQGDFDLACAEEEAIFHDAWRVFGAAYQAPPQLLPERTSMQRAFKGWLMDGRKTGSGVGVLLFDGEKILNQPKFR